MKNVFKWRIVTNKYLYITDENGNAPFLLNKGNGKRTYPSDSVPSNIPEKLDEGAIGDYVSKINNANTYKIMFDNMVNLAMTDNDAKKVTFMPYNNYFNIDGDEFLVKTVTPGCECYEPVFNISAHTIDETEVSYTFTSKRNEYKKTLEYDLNLGIPRGEKGEPGEAGASGYKGDKGEDGKNAEFDSIDLMVNTVPSGSVARGIIQSGITEDGKYTILFNLDIPRGERGAVGASGDKGDGGYDARVVGLNIGKIETLEPNGVAYVTSDNVGVVKNEEYKTWDSTLNLNFGIPKGSKGDIGEPGSDAEITGVTCNVETLDYSTEVENDDGTVSEVINNATCTVTMTPEDGGNRVGFNFDFKIPRGKPGDGKTGGGRGDIVYNFNNITTTPTSTAQAPYFEYTEAVNVLTNTISPSWIFYYPTSWINGTGGGTTDIKHRYNKNTDSLAEGVKDGYPFAIASGVRSHAEGIGGTKTDINFDATIKTDCNGNPLVVSRNYFAETQVPGNLNGAIVKLADDEEPFLTSGNAPWDRDDVFDGVNIGIPPYDKIDDTNGGVEADTKRKEFWNIVKAGPIKIVSSDNVNTESEDSHITYSNVVVQYSVGEKTYERELCKLMQQSERVDDGNGGILSNTLTHSVTITISRMGENAEGVATHTEGSSNHAVGDSSHAEGYMTETIGDYSHAEGMFTITKNIAEHAEGGYNVTHSQYPSEFDSRNGCNTVSSIGIGGSEEDRMNAVEVMQNGDVYVYGIGGYNGTEIKNPDNEIKTLQEVAGKISSSDNNDKLFLIGAIEQSDSVDITHSNIKVYTKGGTLYSNNICIGDAKINDGFYGAISHGVGPGITVNSYGSYAGGVSEGGSIIAGSTGSTAFGYVGINGSIISGGYGSYAGGYSEDENQQVLSNANGSFSHGVGTKATAYGSTSFGICTTANQNGMTAIGRYNTSDNTSGYLFAIGNGSNTNGVQHLSDAFFVKENGDCYASGAYYVSSDERKKDVVGDIPLEKAYKLVDKCQSIYFTWKDDKEKKRQIGMIAQEVRDVFPELVYEDGEGYLSLDYSKLTVILLTVIKDLKERVDKIVSIEERLSKLEGKH